ncbi:hypothetical protein ABK040_005908 [Willaertia magna]
MFTRKTIHKKVVSFTFSDDLDIASDCSSTNSNNTPLASPSSTFETTPLTTQPSTITNNVSPRSSSSPINIVNVSHPFKASSYNDSPLSYKGMSNLVMSLGINKGRKEEKRISKQQQSLLHFEEGKNNMQNSNNNITIEQQQQQHNNNNNDNFFLSSSLVVGMMAHSPVTQIHNFSLPTSFIKENNANQNNSDNRMTIVIEDEEEYEDEMNKQRTISIETLHSMTFQMVMENYTLRKLFKNYLIDQQNPEPMYFLDAIQSFLKKHSPNNNVNTNNNRKVVNNNSENNNSIEGEEESTKQEEEEEQIITPIINISSIEWERFIKELKESIIDKYLVVGSDFELNISSKLRSGLILKMSNIHQFIELIKQSERPSNRKQNSLTKHWSNNSQKNLNNNTDIVNNNVEITNSPIQQIVNSDLMDMSPNNNSAGVSGNNLMSVDSLQTKIKTFKDCIDYILGNIISNVNIQLKEEMFSTFKSEIIHCSQSIVNSYNTLTSNINTQIDIDLLSERMASKSDNLSSTGSFSSNNYSPRSVGNYSPRSTNFFFSGNNNSSSIISNNNNTTTNSSSNSILSNNTDETNSGGAFSEITTTVVDNNNGGKFSKLSKLKKTLSQKFFSKKNYNLKFVQNKDMPNWSVTEFCLYLESQPEFKHLSNLFKQENINGKKYNALSDEELLKLIPEYSIRSSLQNSLQKIAKEYKKFSCSFSLKESTASSGSKVNTFVLIKSTIHSKANGSFQQTFFLPKDVFQSLKRLEEEIKKEIIASLQKKWNVLKCDKFTLSFEVNEGKEHLAKNDSELKKIVQNELKGKTLYKMKIEFVN